MTRNLDSFVLSDTTVRESRSKSSIVFLFLRFLYFFFPHLRFFLGGSSPISKGFIARGCEMLYRL